LGAWSWTTSDVDKVSIKERRTFPNAISDVNVPQASSFRNPGNVGDCSAVYVLCRSVVRGGGIVGGLYWSAVTNEDIGSIVSAAFYQESVNSMAAGRSVYIPRSSIMTLLSRETIRGSTCGAVGSLLECRWRLSRFETILTTIVVSPNNNAMLPMITL